MLCSFTPASTSIYNIISNVKTLPKIEKFSTETPQGFAYLNKFIQKLEMSPAVTSYVHDSLNKDFKLFGGMLFNQRSHRDLNQFLKRCFHSKRSTTKITEMFNSRTVTDDMKKSEEIKEILNKYSSKPAVQHSLFDAYRIGFERSLKMLLEDKQKDRRFFYVKLVVYGFILYYIYSMFTDIGKSVGTPSNTGGISRIFSKSWNSSGATLIHKVDVRFDDVQGCDEVKKELKDIVHFLKDPLTFTKVGAKLPKGILLIGEPGIGKTLLARAVAGEAGVPFLYVSGSQFDEMFVGVGASRVRALFNEAKEHSPCVIFIDELDAVCGKRTSSPGHPYANQTINQLLAEMDGFIENEGIVVIGATNRPQAIDKAALRPGRFDLKVHVFPPDYTGRIALFKLYLSKVNVAEDGIDVPTLARATSGYTGADIKNMVNQAAIICVLKGDNEITMNHLLESQTKILMGAARNRPVEETENRVTAYHEAGHSIVAYFTASSNEKIKMVTILPRGASGGHNSFVPKSETNYRTKAQLKASIDVAMGGRAAEELMFGSENISTGISGDIQSATKIARSMVRLYSMSDEVGLQMFDSDSCSCGGSSRSPQIAETIDKEVNNLLRESYERAKAILQEHSKEWHALANYLLKYETLVGEDVELIINGKKPKVASITESIIDKAQKTAMNAAGTGRFLGFFNKENKK